MPKTILCYVDPVPFHGNPLFFRNKIDLINAIADAHKDKIRICVITSPQLMRFAGNNIAYKYHLPIEICLRHYDGVVTDYLLDICQRVIPTSSHNTDVLNALYHADSIINPDYVLSFTEHVYLRQVFGTRCIFSEVSPIPRWFTQPSLLLDPFGFQFDGGLERYIKLGKRHDFDETFSGAFERFWTIPVASWSNSIGMAEWVRSLKQTRKILILALQPARDINYVGSGIRGDEVALIRRVARDFHSDYQVLVFSHPASSPFEEPLIEEIEESYTNISFPPLHLRHGRAEAALQYADAVAAVSSNMLYLGGILGHEVHPYGASRFSSLKAFNTLDSGKRLDLLAFVVERYALTEACVLQQDFDLVDRIENHREQMFKYNEDGRVATEASLKKFLALSEP